MEIEGTEEEELELTYIKAAEDNLRKRLDELFAMAEDRCKHHLEFVLAQNRTRTWAEHSVLCVNPRLRENKLAVTWYVVKWYGSKAQKTRRMVKKVIVKPKNKYGYNLETLRKIAQPWEWDWVETVEKEVTPLRREAEFIAPCLGKLNKILKGNMEGKT